MSLAVVAWLAALATVAPEIPGVVKGGTAVVQILTSDPELGGEGPVTAPDGSLLFAHQDAFKVIRIDAAGRATDYITNTNRVIGLAFDPQGRLLGIGGKDDGYPQLVVLEPEKRVLVETFEGKRFKTLADLVVDRSGGVYFTHADDDPPPGAHPPAVFYRRPDGTVLKVADGIQRPNAIVLSPDERTLYVANPRGEHVIAFDVEGGGRLKNQRQFAAAPHADGLTVDGEGRLYVASNVGIKVFTPSGRELGTIPIPVRPSNMAFAGRDKKTLYVVGRGGVFSVAMLAQGFTGRAK